MTAPSAPNYTYEGAFARIRIASSAIACLSVEPPKQSFKFDKFGRLGSQVKDVRTQGVQDVEGGSILLESAVFAKQVLPRIPKNGWTQFEFVVTVLQRAPNVNSPFSAIWDRVRFIGTEEEAIEMSEKATKIKLPVDAIQVFYGGVDGVYRSLAIQQGQPSDTAAAFML